jgi:hypothetical protein
MEEQINDGLTEEPKENVLDKLLSEEEKETPSDSSTEEKPTEQTQPSEGENTQDEEKMDQLSKHPRFREVIKEKNEYKQKFEETTRRLNEISPKFEEMQSIINQSHNSPSNQGTAIPEEFINLFGSTDSDAYQQFEKIINLVADRKIKSYEESKHQEYLRKKQEEEAYNNLVSDYKRRYDEQISDLANEHGFEPNEFKIWFRKNPITNEDGTDYNFERAVELFMLQSPKKPSRKTLGEKPSHIEPGQEKKYKTLEDLNNMTWNQLGS